MASTVDMTPIVEAFDKLSLENRASVGGKGASLGELTRAGIRVPPGFVVTTTAFEQFLRAIDPDGAIRSEIEALDACDLSRIDEATRNVRERIVNAALPKPLHEAIVAAHNALCGDDRIAPVAVRSSATSEDSEDASFAGLQETFLWVRGEEALTRALLACWSSLYSVESVSYRLRLKLPEQHVAMGVVVQSMVNARASGVMFTRSPTTGDRSVIAIEGSWGLGSCIVSGEVTPDKFVVSKVTGEIVKRTVSQKSVRHVPSAPGSGVCAEPVPAELQNQPCVADAEIAALAQIAKQVEQHYGCPQDIEWAIDQDGGVYLLQSRPETVWAHRERAPVAAPQKSAFEHVIAALGGRKS